MSSTETGTDRKPNAKHGDCDSCGRNGKIKRSRLWVVTSKTKRPRPLSQIPFLKNMYWFHFFPNNLGMICCFKRALQFEKKHLYYCSNVSPCRPTFLKRFQIIRNATSKCSRRSLLSQKLRRVNEWPAAGCVCDLRPGDLSSVGAGNSREERKLTQTFLSHWAFSSFDVLPE